MERRSELTILIPRWVNDKKVTTETFLKRKDIIGKVSDTLRKYNVEPVIINTDNVSSRAKFNSLMDNGWSIHAVDLNVYNKEGLLDFISKHLGDAEKEDRSKLFWSLHSLGELNENLELDVKLT